TINDVAQSDDFFTGYLFSISAERQILSSIRPFVGGFYQCNDYINMSRTDNLWGFTGGLGYNFLHDIFRASVEYDHTKRDSDHADEEYAENQISLRLTARYDLGE
ncbi:MAG: outer membrane beta-barrel protein, partial [Syntrophobacteraceae bacterium]